MKDKKERELLVSVSLKDCDVKPYKGSGPGGQKKNKTESAIRIVHRDSGAVGQCENHREQIKNKKEAFLRMIETKEFKSWLKIANARATGELARIEKRVEQEMKKVVTEIKDEKGRWKKVDKLEGE
ncbi:peptide chain release factor-like protein [bacterium]|nr:peptide chain release factor-like protein [bacterium]